MVETNSSKQVRVDNWGIFFLQRLQMFFSKTDYCDLTLQFEENVQLKVHRLVMSACTDYFQALEQNCAGLEENVIIMPADLQSDVIVPIVNFMYTGMLEFHPRIYTKLCKAAELMNITVLTKLLDAQRGTINTPRVQKYTPVKKNVNKTPELPVQLPGRKIPVWKRKIMTSVIGAPNSPSSQHDGSSHFDNTPKPTRFDWPEDDLPEVRTWGFGDYSYNSKPLLTKDEESRLDEIKKSGRSSDSEDSKDDVEETENGTTKRKLDKNSALANIVKKRIKLVDNTEMPIKLGDQTIETDKIVEEIMKKYPQLVKSNKNIRLKIMTTGSKAPIKDTMINIKKPMEKGKIIGLSTSVPGEIQKVADKGNTEGPWSCAKCPDEQFALYYLYRKHMIDEHEEKFEEELCKYCGHHSRTILGLNYHLSTKHGISQSANSPKFPQCEKCPFLAFSNTHLKRHQKIHLPNEVRCEHCHLTFRNDFSLKSHQKITNHAGKPVKLLRKPQYDCQYCTKLHQTPQNLFHHIKTQHKFDANRDGVVALMEDEEEEDFELYTEDEEDEDDPLITGIKKENKVKILSDVRVTDSAPNIDASSSDSINHAIPPGLSLVDIVVLDDNQQQFILRTQHDDQSSQNEFILPTTDSFPVPVTNNYTTCTEMAGSNTGSFTGTGSTDELVMVLTDHDYNDAETSSDITGNNSNIVVLYSHPIDGACQSGNEFVGGMLDLVVNNAQNAPIESIEMIQQEINNHTTAVNKQPPNFYSAELNSELKEDVDGAESILEEAEPVKVSEDKSESVPMEVEPEEPQSNIEEDSQRGEANLEHAEETKEVEAPNEILPVAQNEDAPENPSDSSESVEALKEEEEESLKEPVNKPENIEKESSENYTPEAMEIDGTNEDPQPEEDVEKPEEEEAVDAPKDEPKEIEIPKENEEEDILKKISDDILSDNELSDIPPEMTRIDADLSKTSEVLDESLTEESDNIVSEKDLVINSTSQSASDVGKLSENDEAESENSQQSKFSESAKNSHLAKIAILDEWDCDTTDSQHSDKQQDEELDKTKGADETVNKLIGDWEDDEEDDEDSEKKAVTD